MVLPKYGLSGRVQDMTHEITTYLGCWKLLSPGCVYDHNIIIKNNISIPHCKKLCNQNSKCLAFEYGVDHGVKQDPSHPLRVCQLQNSLDYDKCDASRYNLDLYIKIGCLRGIPMFKIFIVLFFESFQIRYQFCIAFYSDWGHHGSELLLGVVASVRKMFGKTISKNSLILSSPPMQEKKKVDFS